MGSGKSTVGKRLARRLGLSFIDSDKEIEARSGCSIASMFRAIGETGFRERERQVIAELVEGAPQVIATGGGAFIDPATRALLNARAITIWLRADISVLAARVARRSHRPLLHGRDPRTVLEELSASRDPSYAQAHFTVPSEDVPHHVTVNRIIAALGRRAST